MVTLSKLIQTCHALILSIICIAYFSSRLLDVHFCKFKLFIFRPQCACRPTRTRFTEERAQYTFMKTLMWDNWPYNLQAGNVSSQCKKAPSTCSASCNGSRQHAGSTAAADKSRILGYLQIVPSCTERKRRSRDSANLTPLKSGDKLRNFIIRIFFLIDRDVYSTFQVITHF